MSVLVFEDEAVRRLEPVTLGRPALAISCGAYRLVDWLASFAQPVAVDVRPHLRALVAEDFPELKSALPDGFDGSLLILNARLVPSVAVFDRVRALVATGKPGVVHHASGLAAALLPPGAVKRALNQPHDWVTRVGELKLPALDVELPLIEYPHDVIRHHQTTLAANLEHRLKHGEYTEIADGVFSAPGAELGSYCVTDSKAGPIVLEAGARVGPYCLLSGPAYLGRGARVLEHAAIKDGVALGHTTKIGGEVEASIVEPFTNKQHHGFLGHSYMGSWVNLGAGTCNSDLKNTYGQVNMEYGGQKVATGMQFVGAIVGDYAKTAINTGIFTGKTIGVCSMVYGFVTTNVPSFVNYARLFGQVTEAPVDVMIATQRRMFERRGVKQRECDIQLLHDMYALTAEERRPGGESLSLEPLSL